ncbi:MAG: hypothetical protein QUV20_13705 [Oceanibaculum nanhaiense]|uniref:hypothetical protein n=1 Tax=Oceanibaculum nanhaiense TaxID=1909734 RepID=UPI0025A36836|nr:hypothetical protein [Oceanibaculum nanhaiense]MDM7947379.1 hypothetical protein [Oceanibaculum nanhaiense]
MEKAMSQIGFVYQSMATVAKASVTGIYANLDNINQLRQQLSQTVPPQAAEAPAPVAASSGTEGRVDISV